MLKDEEKYDHNNKMEKYSINNTTKNKLMMFEKTFSFKQKFLNSKVVVNFM